MEPNNFARQKLESMNIEITKNTLIGRIEDGDINTVKLLLDAGINPNFTYKYGDFPLHAASLRGNCKMIKLLFNYGAEANLENADGETALIVASKNDDIETAKILLSNGAGINYSNKKGETAFMYACQSRCWHVSKPFNDVEFVRFLLDNGADINVQDKNGVTPLMRASSIDNNKGHKIVEYLIKNGANVDCIDSLGNSALWWAVNTSNSDIVKILLECGINPNLKNKNGETIILGPILYAEGNVKTVELLIKYGADINVQTSDGWTPLMLATSQTPIGWTPQNTTTPKGQYQITKLLIKNKANINAENKHNKTALNYAIKNNFKEIIQLLRSHGAKTGEELNLLRQGSEGQVEEKEKLKTEGKTK